MKYLNYQELNQLSNEDLLKYKKDLLRRKSALLEEASRWGQCYKEHEFLLKDRLEDIELDLIEAEENRLAEDHYLNILQ